MRRRAGLAVAALTFVGLLAPATATAHTEKTVSSVAVSWTGSAFNVEVESSQGCTKNRSVSLFRRGESGALATLSTDANGNGQFAFARQNGDYYVKVAKRVRKRNESHKHICKPATSTPDTKIRDCDTLTLFAGGATQEVDVDDDLTVYIEGVVVFLDDNGLADTHAPINLGPASFGDDIRIVATNSPSFGTGPVSLDPLSVQCSAAAGSGSAVLDGTGVPPGTEDEAGAVFYDQTYVLPVITLTR